MQSDCKRILLGPLIVGACDWCLVGCGCSELDFLLDMLNFGMQMDNVVFWDLMRLISLTCLMFVRM